MNDRVAMRQSCSDCKLLWEEYEVAVRNHLRLVVQYQTALEQDDTELLCVLDVSLSAAEDRRNQARQRVRDHEKKHLKDAEGQDPA